MQEQLLEYSPRPRLDYTVDIEGNMQGIGCHPGYMHNPGAWNVTYLSTCVMDQFLTHSKQPDQLPYSSVVTPAAIGTSYQHLSTGKTVGDLSLELEPQQWWDTVKSDPEFNELILYKIYGDAWVVMVEERIKQYKINNSANIIQGNFGVQ